MKYYTTTAEFNCGIDLHARQMYVCVMDRQGKKLVHTNVKNNDFEFFLKLVEPYRHDLTVCCECMFGWYWLADKCHQAGLTFILAHALYQRCIHGGKNKNDCIDSEKITHLRSDAVVMPPPAADFIIGATSAISLRWAHQQSGRFDWDLSPVAYFERCGNEHEWIFRFERMPAGTWPSRAVASDTPDLPSIHSRRRSGCVPAEPYPPLEQGHRSKQRNQPQPHNLRTKTIWSIRPNGTSAKNWSPALRDSRLSN